MRGSCCVIFMLILLPIGQCALSSPVVAEEQNARPSLMLLEVLPRFPFEHIGIVNCGTDELDLVGWSVSDGEGSWTFVEGARIGAGEAIFIGTNLTFMELVHPGALLLDASADMARKGRLALADDGDEVLLLDGALLVVDIVAYGKAPYTGIGWRGARCAVPPEGKALARVSGSGGPDTDTAADWAVQTLGRSRYATSGTEAAVEAFLCPEDMRSRVIRELRFSQRTAEVAVYLLSDHQVAGALIAAAKRGVRVRILVEGNPVGGLTESQLHVLEALSLSGCEVHQTQAFHGFKRYDYLHCKYLVVDARRVLLASENWAWESLDSNRGWGASLESRELAATFLSVFEQDFDLRFPDVTRICVSPHGEIPYLPEPELDPEATAPTSTRAHVEVVIAPELSYEALLSTIQGAKRRLLLELFYISDTWPQGRDLFQAIAEAARRGASVRLLLDGNWYNNDGNKGNQAMASELNQVASAEGLDLRAKVISPYHPFTTLHNKGAVADDTVLVCSINWVRASLEENREAGVIIRSSEVAGFFSDSFEEDWMDDVVAPSLSVVSYLEAQEGEEVVLSANVSDNSGSVRVLWDIGEDGSYEGEGPFLTVRLPVGEHHISVLALDPENNSCKAAVTVRVMPRGVGTDLGLPVVGAIVAGITFWSIRKRVKRE